MEAELKWRPNAPRRPALDHGRQGNWKVGQTIVSCRLLGWAFGPQNFMKNSIGSVLGFVEQVRDLPRLGWLPLRRGRSGTCPTSRRIFDYWRSRIFNGLAWFFDPCRLPVP